MTSLSTAAAMRKIIDELSVIFLERREATEIMVLTALAKQNGLMFGPPGTAKSEMLHAFCQRLIGGKYARFLLDRHMGKEDFFGAIDVPLYTEHGRWERDITDTLLDAHLALFDEVDKVGATVANMTLTAINERMGKPARQWIKLPLISVFGAANAELEPELAPFGDRFATRQVVNYIVEPDNFIALLDSVDQPTAIHNPTCLPVDDLAHAIHTAVPAVQIPRALKESVEELRAQLRSRGLVVSDRRYKQGLRLVQAAAWLDERAVAIEDDLAVYRHCLWDHQEHRVDVAKLVMEVASPLTRDILAVEQMLVELNDELNEVSDEEMDERAARAGHFNYRVQEIGKRIDTLRKRADERGALDRFSPLDTALSAVRNRIFRECIGMQVPRDAA